VDYEDIWHLAEQVPLGNSHLFVAAIAPVVFDLLPFDVLRQTFIDIADSLYLKTKIIEWFECIPDIPAGSADQLRQLGALENIPE